MVNKNGRNPPPPDNYVKPIPTPAPPKVGSQYHSHQTVVPKEVYDRLSPARRQVIITLLSITSPSDDPWVVEVYDAVNNAFFEKAARLILPHSSRLSRKMLMGE